MDPASNKVPKGIPGNKAKHLAGNKPSLDVTWAVKARIQTLDNAKLKTT